MARTVVISHSIMLPDKLAMAGIIDQPRLKLKADHKNGVTHYTPTHPLQGVSKNATLGFCAVFA